MLNQLVSEWKSLIIACQLGLSLSGCGGREEDVVSDIREAGEDVSLQAKNFTSSCSIEPLDSVVAGLLTSGQAAVKSVKTQYRFIGSNLERRTVLFEAGDCSGSASATFLETGSFDILGDSQTADGGQFIDFDFSALTLRIDNQAGATVANAVSLCGTNTWSSGAEADVTAKAADANCYGASVPRKVANVYKLENDVLYLGTQTRDSIADNFRPTTINAGIAYTAE